MNSTYKKGLIFVCVFIIFFCIIILFSPKEKIKSFIDIDNSVIDIYTNDIYIVKDYSTFYTIQDIIINLISDFNDNKFDEVYKITSNEFKNKINNEEYKLKIPEYFSSNFDLKKGYNNFENLINVYAINSKEFIAEVKTLKGITKIGISLVTNDEYVITYLDV